MQKWQKGVIELAKKTGFSRTLMGRWVTAAGMGSHQWMEILPLSWLVGFLYPFSVSSLPTLVCTRFIAVRVEQLHPCSIIPSSFAALCSGVGRIWRMEHYGTQGGHERVKLLAWDTTVYSSVLEDEFS